MNIKALKSRKNFFYQWKKTFAQWFSSQSISDNQTNTLISPIIVVRLVHFYIDTTSHSISKKKTTCDFFCKLPIVFHH